MADEAYAQKYSTGTTRVTSTNSATPAGSLIALPWAICQSIDRAKSAGEKRRFCKELFQTLSNGNGPAYEWQQYYSRCGP